MQAAREISQSIERCVTWGERARAGLTRAEVSGGYEGTHLKQVLGGGRKGVRKR